MEKNKIELDGGSKYMADSLQQNPYSRFKLPLLAACLFSLWSCLSRIELRQWREMIFH